MANIFNEQIPVGQVIDPANHAILTVGQYIVEHYRRGAAERGHEAVARQLRKQGVPLEIARLILLGRTA